MGDSAFQDCIYLRIVVLSDEIETLGSAFQNSGIEEIVLPSKLKHIDPNAFSSCDSLRIIWTEDSCTADIASAISDSVAVLQKSMKLGDQLLWDLRRQKELVIPGGTERIGRCWFCCSDAESVTVPASVRELGDEAFCNCRQLLGVKFSEDS